MRQMFEDRVFAETSHSPSGVLPSGEETLNHSLVSEMPQGTSPDFATGQGKKRITYQDDATLHQQPRKCLCPV